MSTEHATSDKRSVESTSNLSREELEERVRDLENQVDLLNERMNRSARSGMAHTAFMHFLERLLGEDFDDYGAAPHDYLDDVAAFREQAVGGPDADASDALTRHWHSVTEYAETVSGHPNHRRSDGSVSLYRDDVAAACDVGKRRAQELIEELGEEFPDLSWQPHQPASSSTKGNARRKQLIVDLEE